MPDAQSAPVGGPLPRGHLLALNRSLRRTLEAEKRGLRLSIPTSSGMLSPPAGWQRAANVNKLILVAGWKSRMMIDRYLKATAAERARATHARLSPADRL
jgi:hypothetical protein